MQYGSIPPEAIPEDIATHYGEYTDPLDMLKELSKSLQKSSNSFMNDLYMERYIDDVQEANWEGALLMLRVIDVVVRYCIDRAENQKTKH